MSTASRRPQFVLGALGGGLTAMLWFVSEWFLPWEVCVRLLWLPLALLVSLFVLGARRKQLSTALGYLAGISPAVALHLLVLVVFTALSAWASVDAFAERLQRRPFDAVAWRQHRDDGTRGRMADDLLDSQRLVGITFQDARALLGPPSANLGGTECRLAYWLGTERGGLCLAGEANRVEEVRFREYHD